MTGMVKEMILTRQAELGLIFDNGRLVFDGVLFDQQELLVEPAVFSYLDVDGRRQQIDLEPGSLACTVCQTLVVLQIKGRAGIKVYFAGGTHQLIEGNILDEENSWHIFQRDGFIHHLVVGISTKQ
jgi:hypothetical protein